MTTPLEDFLDPAKQTTFTCAVCGRVVPISAAQLRLMQRLHGIMTCGPVCAGKVLRQGEPS